MRVSDHEVASPLDYSSLAYNIELQQQVQVVDQSFQCLCVVVQIARLYTCEEIAAIVVCM